VYEGIYDRARPPSMTTEIMISIALIIQFSLTHGYLPYGSSDILLPSLIIGYYIDHIVCAFLALQNIIWLVRTYIRKKVFNFRCYKQILSKYTLSSSSSWVLFFTQLIVILLCYIRIIYDTLFYMTHYISLLVSFWLFHIFSLETNFF
jgi:hypothetical protein